MEELLALAKELEDAAQYDNSSNSLRSTMDEVAAKLRDLAAKKVL